MNMKTTESLFHQWWQKLNWIHDGTVSALVYQVALILSGFERFYSTGQVRNLHWGCVPLLFKIIAIKKPLYKRL